MSLVSICDVINLNVRVILYNTFSSVMTSSELWCRKRTRGPELLIQRLVEIRKDSTISLMAGYFVAYIPQVLGIKNHT